MSAQVTSHSAPAPPPGGGGGGAASRLLLPPSPSPTASAAGSERLSASPPPPPPSSGANGPIPAAPTSSSSGATTYSGRISATIPTVANNKHLLGNSNSVISTKTERVPLDDGVDLSYDCVKKEVKEEVMMVKKEVKEELEDSHRNSTSSGRSSNGSPSLVHRQNNLPPGGRLKFFKEGRVLLELEHRFSSDGDKVQPTWVPTGSRKVYWPPVPTAAPLTSRLDSNASNHTASGSEASSIDCGSSLISHAPRSPWQQTPSPSSTSGAAAPLSNGPVSTTAWHPAPPHRHKKMPKKVVFSNDLAGSSSIKSEAIEEEVDSSTDKLQRRQRVLLASNNDLVFAMKPPQGVRNYRRKLRTFRAKCRQPVSEIKIGTFILKLECQAAAGRPVPRRKAAFNCRSRAQREVRLEALVGRLTAVAKRPVHVPINAWRSGRADLQNLVLRGGGSNPGSPISYTGTGIKVVKSELKMVTETCTLPVGTLSSSTAGSPRSHKTKSEGRTITAETRTVPVRAMPITPTIARIKSDSVDHASANSRLKASTITSLMSPEMARVRMEIGPMSPGSERGLGGDSSSFVSPRKRYLDPATAALSGSPAKLRRLSSGEHHHGRLSTDSVSSGGDRRQSPHHHPAGLPLSPQPSMMGSPRHNNGSSVGKSGISSFSIDSLMSGNNKDQSDRSDARSRSPPAARHHHPYYSGVGGAPGSPHHQHHPPAERPKPNLREGSPSSSSFNHRRLYDGAGGGSVPGSPVPRVGSPFTAPVKREAPPHHHLREAFNRSPAPPSGHHHLGIPPSPAANKHPYPPHRPPSPTAAAHPYPPAAGLPPGAGFPPANPFLMPTAHPNPLLAAQQLSAALLDPRVAGHLAASLAAAAAASTNPAAAAATAAAAAFAAATAANYPPFSSAGATGFPPPVSAAAAMSNNSMAAANPLVSNATAGMGLPPHLVSAYSAAYSPYLALAAAAQQHAAAASQAGSAAGTPYPPLASLATASSTTATTTTTNSFPPPPPSVGVSTASAGVWTPPVAPPSSPQPMSSHPADAKGSSRGVEPLSPYHHHSPVRVPAASSSSRTPSSAISSPIASRSGSAFRPAVRGEQRYSGEDEDRLAASYRQERRPLDRVKEEDREIQPPVTSTASSIRQSSSHRTDDAPLNLSMKRPTAL